MYMLSVSQSASPDNKPDRLLITTKRCRYVGSGKRISKRKSSKHKSKSVTTPQNSIRWKVKKICQAKGCGRGICVCECLSGKPSIHTQEIIWGSNCRCKHADNVFIRFYLPSLSTHTQPQTYKHLNKYIFCARIASCGCMAWRLKDFCWLTFLYPIQFFIVLGCYVFQIAFTDLFMCLFCIY